MAVCQPTVPVFAAVSLLEAERDRSVPRSMILMAGPIDARVNPTAVNRFADGRSLEWFERNVITQVPWPNKGMMRHVYPGFLQLSGFMGMNLDRHITAHRELFHNLIRGDGDSADKHREFYDEFLAVMDLTAEYYLQTIDTVFLRHALPKGGDGPSQSAGRPSIHPPGCAHDGGRREGRHLGNRPDLRCP
jgi:poly(3-hydroxybutyrate) depolymerase